MATGPSSALAGLISASGHWVGEERVRLSKTKERRGMKNELLSLTPLDGRYRDQTAGLVHYFSEAALIRHRILVEAKWLLELNEVLPQVSLRGAAQLCLSGWSDPPRVDSELMLEAASRVKGLEQTTRHDVKAVEYFLREELEAVGEGAAASFLHFAATSEDINNLAYALMTQGAVTQRLVPLLGEVVGLLIAKVREYHDKPMLARTHGQPATPTTMGKELAVYLHRLNKQIQRLGSVKFEGKFNGAVGNYNAHLVAYPDVDWESVTSGFISSLGLSVNSVTTQIEGHDSLIELLGVMSHINGILLGLCRDFWSYISLGYFKLKTIPGEVGSSTMPHKVNPISFENAEGNLGLAIGAAHQMESKLVTSRWQRDLSDSTVMRSLGVVFGYTEVALQSILRGLRILDLDEVALAKDLSGHWELLAEPLQMVLRKFGDADAYEHLRLATRGKAIDRQQYLDLVNQATSVPKTERLALSRLTPENYLGLASKLALGVANGEV